MATEKLFYVDCHMQQFSATVISCTQTEQGFAVVLDRTAFYPEGGGQACDTGNLSQVRVLAVREKGDEVVHICDGALMPGETVKGRIDYDRRFDLMQQHTGEHILSGVIHSRYGFHNAGFHVGQQVMEVDFDGVIPVEGLAQLELEANQAVWRNLPVKATFPSEKELAALTYRTKKALPWPVRIVEIPGVDSCACCGVHTAYTGEVGLIKILSCAKFRQGVRLELVCGKRAWNYVNQTWEQNREISRLLSAKMPETAAAVKRLSDQLGEEKLCVANMQRQLFSYTAAAYAGKGNVVHFEPALSGGQLRQLAEAVAGRCGGVAAVLSGEKENYAVCLACPRGDVSALGKAMAEALNGRGGGKAGFYQGTLQADRKKIQTFFIEQFS